MGLHYTIPMLFKALKRKSNRKSLREQFKTSNSSSAKLLKQKSSKFQQLNLYLSRSKCTTSTPLNYLWSCLNLPVCSQEAGESQKKEPRQNGKILRSRKESRNKKELELPTTNHRSSMWLDGAVNQVKIIYPQLWNRRYQAEILLMILWITKSWEFRRTN